MRRNIREKGRRRDRDELKQMARAIYPAENRKQACVAFRRFKVRWQSGVSDDGETVREGSGAPVGVFQFPQTSWKRLRTTNIIIERCFAEVRRRTRSDGLLCKRAKR